MATVLVIGAGRFGRHYLTVLGMLARPLAIDTLVISRTRLKAARAMAAEIAARQGCPFKQVAGVAVRDVTQLAEVLAQYVPDLTCIVARDEVIGDDIHAVYAPPALEVGAVLCEKPFCRARGDGSGPATLQALTRHPHAARFGLELPLVVMERAMADHSHMAALYRGARKISFVWEKARNGSDLIDDLVLHPWSLLPPSWQTTVTDVHKGIDGADIGLRLVPGTSADRTVQGHIRLAVGGGFRGMSIDSHVFEFLFAQGKLQLWEHDAPWEAVTAGRPQRRRRLLAVDNPLARHIAAAFRGAPLVDIHRTARSQQFLEHITSAGKRSGT